MISLVFLIVTCIYIYTCICIYIYIYLCIHIYVHKYIYIHTYVYIYMYIYIHIYVRIYLHLLKFVWDYGLIRLYYFWSLFKTPRRGNRTPACLHAPWVEVTSEHQPDSPRLARVKANISCSLVNVVVIVFCNFCHCRARGYFAFDSYWYEVLCMLICCSFDQDDSCGVRTRALAEWRLEPPP